MTVVGLGHQKLSEKCSSSGSSSMGPHGDPQPSCASVRVELTLTDIVNLQSQEVALTCTYVSLINDVGLPRHKRDSPHIRLAPPASSRQGGHDRRLHSYTMARKAGFCPRIRGQAVNMLLIKVCVYLPETRTKAIKLSKQPPL
jgi:hypothetical protein